MSNTEVIETKICKKCGRILPVDKFRLVRGQFYNPYYLGQCKECEYRYQREYLEEKNKVEFSDNLEILIERHYKIVRNNYKKTGDDSEEFILKVMNDMRYKPGDWSKSAMLPIMCGIGYRGSEDVDCQSESYLRWHDMINRCYNKKFLESHPQYRGCTVCEEWLNYSPETVAFVPHVINTLFVNCKESRGDLPVGVYYDNDKGKYRSEMMFLGEPIKLGYFDTAESAFARYKEYKEDFIKDMAEQYKDKIPYKVYEAMMNWDIEIAD